MEKVEVNPITTVKEYFTKLFAYDTDSYRKHEAQINRKLCFKKINENLRKRNKTKSSDDVN